MLEQPRAFVQRGCSGCSTRRPSPLPRAAACRAAAKKHTSSGVSQIRP